MPLIARQCARVCRACKSCRADQHKIGVLLPLSGAGARAGTRALRGIELALATVQERDPALQLSMVVRDSTQQAATAQDALRTLVDEEHVIGVIGPLLSRIAIELAPLAGQLGMPLISPYARDSDFPALECLCHAQQLDGYSARARPGRIRYQCAQTPTFCHSAS